MSHRAIVEELATFLDPAESSRSSWPIDPAIGWPALLHVAAEHQLLPALQAALERRGVGPLPPALRATNPTAPLTVLADAYAANATRVTDLRDQGSTVLGALQTAAIPVVPIKGMHGLLAGWWPDPAARVMVDVDVLVPGARIDDAVAVAEELGYRDLGTQDPEGKAGHQRPAMGRRGHLGSLELHTAPFVPRRRRILSTEDIFASAASIDVDGRTIRVPNPTHTVVVAIGHAQLQDDGARYLRLPLRGLVDVTAMATSGALDQVDFHEVSARFTRVHARLALAGFATALDTLFGIDLPVARRGGAEWLNAVTWAGDHPVAAHRYREVVSLPGALSARRMKRLYGADSATSRTTARARHVAGGARKRLAGIGDPHADEANR